MTKEQPKNPDFVLLAVIITMMVLGILILSSASAMLAQSKFHYSYYLIKHQAMMGILPGFFLGFLAYKIPLGLVRKFAPLFLLAAVSLLILVFVPGFGFSAGGAQRWIHLGFASIQPSEVLKLVFIVYLASWLSSRIAGRKNSKTDFSNTLGAFLLVIGLVGFLLLKQPDLSTFGIVVVTAFAMYFLSGTPLRHTFLMVGVGVLALLVLVYSEPYRLDRLSSWLSPESDPLGKNFQANQALIIVGSGGVFGQGLGSSSSKYTLLPELIGDSVFAPYAQELGFAGSLLLVGLFVLFAWRGFSVARASNDKFEYLLACGIIVWITLQAVINISSTTGLIPLSGIPLPFISYGGTAIAVELAAAGLLLNISRQSRSL
ncbi:MAG: putative lipid II flippase FtsW [Candidatus Nealsonbacteria bacterium DGGOD1a]|jgi:cell division protein FtsW|nr:MAG: putative lipid II flippase FtsW [Candidatus Nealsonbacteria bacterium DGGOD1a]